jgi:hypothetical protein
LKIQATQFKTYHGYVAYVNDPYATKSQEFHAFIDWGDKSKPTPGHIHHRSTGRFAVISAHRYVKTGVFAITVTLRDRFGRKVATVSPVHVIN